MAFIFVVAFLIIDHQEYQKNITKDKKGKPKPETKRVGWKIIKEKIFQKDNPLEVKSDADTNSKKE